MDKCWMVLIICGTTVWGHVPVPQPYFTSSSNSIEMVENGTVWLPCNVDNLGETVVRWWRGETLLADSSDHSHPRPARMRVWLNNTLEITNVQKEDSAEYVCQAVRKEPWSPLHLTHSITVLYPPEIFPEPKTGLVDVRLGDTLEIACPAKGVPTPKVTWTVQDKEVPNGNQHVLTLKANSPKVAQRYTCTADNGIGHPPAVQFQVQVLYKPIVIADVSWLHAAPGLHAELICGVSAEPSAKVQWFLGDEIVETSHRMSPYVKGHQHILQFRNITSEDFGEYSCRATNSEGTSEAKVELSGRARPAVFKRDMKKFNNSVLLIWEVDSYSPIIDYSLKFRQVPAPDDQEWITIVVPADGMSPGPIHSKSYMLAGLQTSSTYETVVLSRNRYGLSAPSAPFLFATEGAEFAINGSDEDSNEDSSEASTEDEETNWIAVAIEENSMIREALNKNGTPTSTISSFLCIWISILYYVLH